MCSRGSSSASRGTTSTMVTFVLLTLAINRSLCSVAPHPATISVTSHETSGHNVTDRPPDGTIDRTTHPPDGPANVTTARADSTRPRKDTSASDAPVPPEGQIPLERLPSNTLLKYTAYKDVSILHFRIPTDTRTAFFSFKAYEESKGAFQRNCKPNDITLHLKAGSYPVISPENITFPKHFLDAEERFEIHSLQFKSDSTTRRLSIEGPHPGNWFAVAFISWTDPNNERIEQQGLAASCETLLMSEMSVVSANPQMLNVDVRHEGTLVGDQREPKTFKFYVPSNVSIVTWRFSITQPCSNCTDVSFHVQASALPTARNYLQNAIICPNQTGDVSIDFYPHESAWHYVDLDFLRESPPANGATIVAGSHGNETAGSDASSANEERKTEAAATNAPEAQTLMYTVELLYHAHESVAPEAAATSTPSIEESPAESADSSDESDTLAADAKSLPNRSFDRYPVLRQTYREFFMFDYDLLPDVNGTVPVTLNLTAGVPALMKFDVNDVYDIGGTLSFAVAMRQDLKGSLIDARHESTNEHAGVVAEKLIDIQEEFVPELPAAMTTTTTTTTTTSTTTTTAVPPSTTETEKTRQTAKANQTVIVCLRLEEPGIPTWPDKCVYGRHIYPAAIVINNTDADTNTGLVHVPFPEPGSWYVTLGLFCHGSEATARSTIIDSVKEFVRSYRATLDAMRPPCSCTDRIGYYRSCLADDACLGALNETETLKIKECIMDAKCTGSRSDEMARKFELHHKYATEQSVQGGVADATCNSSVVFTISSSPCVAGRCGRFGRCYHYMSGGFVFSTCLCLRNYRGWDCTEDSQVPSSASILLASLMLTLSNLLFLPSIFYAVKRGYHSEAIIYFFAMFFSAFYHACDSGEEEFSFCLVKIGVLQFCDFYCGLLAIWVTLIAMSNIRHQFVSLLHMLGAILLAFGTELNKQSLWVFLAPALTGICLISVSWGLRCRKTKRCFPARSYLALYLPIGSVLVMVGLVCFAFLQTKQNYHIVHSIWHMVMALSILCLHTVRIYLLNSGSPSTSTQSQSSGSMSTSSTTSSCSTASTFANTTTTTTSTSAVISPSSPVAASCTVSTITGEHGGAVVHDQTDSIQPTE
uniref:EGF-like domain-containing protein n=1 Tax=Anopheles dirus TaxID=7168 RepID=A0A182NR87_9DIPT